MKLVVIFFSSIFISCSAVERFEKLEERVESLEVKNRELDSNINYLAEKLSRLYAGLEELSGKVKQNLESISNLDVSLDTSKPHPAIPEPYLREDQELASKQGLKLRAELFRFLNSVTRGEFPMVLSSADNILKNQVSLEVQLSVLFWKFVSLIELKNLQQALYISRDLIDKFPNAKRISFVLYKQAGIFEAMGDIKARNIVLEKLIKDFPNSVEASEAKKIIGKKR